MTLHLLALAVAGGLGAVCRFLLDSAIPERPVAPARSGEPPRLGLLIVNVSGSVLLGVLLGAVTAPGLVPPAGGWAELAGLGFLGGYTTFSAASAETVRALSAGHVRSAVIGSLGMLALSTAGAGAGWWLGRSLLAIATG